MKLLYITNAINGSGGLERVLAIKTAGLLEQCNYKVYILTLNNGDINPFFDFHPAIRFYDIKVEGNPMKYFFKYRNGIQKIINLVNPDVISVCDDGLKGLLFPFFFGKKIPIIYERHVSKQIAINGNSTSLLSQLKNNLLFSIMDVGGNQFHKFVVLTKGNLKEWKLKNTMVIPNPLPFYPVGQSSLGTKKVLAVGKQGYQKGYDRLLLIWQLVHQKHPDWQLEIYGKLDAHLGLERLAINLGINEVVHFYPPVKNIESIYKEASIFVLSSRFEGFGMVLIEAMSYGVPCISFDCPHGPADIISNKVDGYLIENGAINLFAAATIELIEDAEKRITMGQKAKVNVQRYLPKSILLQWDTMFKMLANKK